MFAPGRVRSKQEEWVSSVAPKDSWVVHAWQEAAPDSDVCNMEQPKEEPDDELVPPSVSSHALGLDVILAVRVVL